LSHYGHGHRQQRGDVFDDTKQGKQRYHVAAGATNDERRKEPQGMFDLLFLLLFIYLIPIPSPRAEFNNACGLMSLDDPNMGGGVEPDGEAFSSDPAQVSDAGDGESGKDSSKATPLAASGYEKRVASFPSSKTPIVEREIGDMGMMYGGGGGGEQNLAYPVRAALHGAGAAVQQHGNDDREDLREAAVMGRKAPTTLNLRPRMARGRGDDANVRSCSFLISRIPFLSFDSHPCYSSMILLRVKNPSPPTPFRSQTRHLEIRTTY
jgi:hypothetical protein